MSKYMRRFFCPACDVEVEPVTYGLSSVCRDCGAPRTVPRVEVGRYVRVRPWWLCWLPGFLRWEVLRVEKRPDPRTLRKGTARP